MSELPTDLVTYNRPVRCVHWSNTDNGVNTVTVECDDGERIAADHVIVTVPLGRLLHTHCTTLISVHEMETTVNETVQAEEFISCGVVLFWLYSRGGGYG